MRETCTELVASKGLILRPLTGRGFLTERTLKAGALLHKAAWLKAFKAIFSQVALLACAGLTVSSEIQVNWSWQMLADVALSLRLDLQVARRCPVFLNLLLNCVHVVPYMETFIRSRNRQKLLRLHLFKVKGGPQRNLQIDVIAFHRNRFGFVFLFLGGMKTGGDASNGELWLQLCEDETVPGQLLTLVSTGLNSSS